MKKSLLKNSAWLLIAQSLVKMISFFYTIFLARALGVEDFGVYTAALAYFSLISAMSDLGVTRYLVRELAIDQRKLSLIFATTTAYRLGVSLLFFLLFALGIYILDPSDIRSSLSILVVLAVLPQSVALSLDAIYVALLKMKYSAAGILILSIISTLSGIILVGRGWGMWGAAASLIIGQVFYSISLISLGVWQKKDMLGRIDLGLMKKIIKGSLPYGILGILSLTYFKVDTLLLTYIKGPYETGIYGAAYRFLEAIIFVPSAISTALFPVLSRLHKYEPSSLKKVYYKSLLVYGLISLPILFSFMFILPSIISFLLPSYLQSITALKILSLSIPFIFLHVPGATVLLATDKYLITIIYLSIFTLSFNVITNLILIPKFGFIGSSWTTVFSEVVTFFTFLVFLKKSILK